MRNWKRNIYVWARNCGKTAMKIAYFNKLDKATKGDKKLTLIQIIKRIYRVAAGHCAVCGRGYSYNRKFLKIGYCSFECASYDGVFSITQGNLRKPSLFKGYFDDYRDHYWPR